MNDLTRPKEFFCHFESFDHEESVWKIILPDYLAGICHCAQCDWLRYLSGSTISRESRTIEFGFEFEFEFELDLELKFE
jgi:hypothetical protein